MEEKNPPVKNPMAEWPWKSSAPEASGDAEALRLAEALNAPPYPWIVAREAASTLRRLAAEVERLKKPSKPLTADGIQEILRKVFADESMSSDDVAFVRAIEAAHGITGDTK